MPRLTQETADIYVELIDRAIVLLRFRIRNGDNVMANEVHDYLDALHNIPGLIRGAGEWYTEENISQDLKAYDDRWLAQPGPSQRKSLVTMLDRIRAGE